MTPPVERDDNEGEETSQAKRVKFSDLTEEEENTPMVEKDDDDDIESYPIDDATALEILDTLPTFSDLTLDEQERICPLENPLFQLFSVRVNYNHMKPGNVHGSILVVDEFESLKDGWMAQDPETGCKFVSLFDHSENDPQPISDNGFLSLTNTSCVCSIPASKSLEIISEVFVTVDDGDKGKLEVSNYISKWTFSIYHPRIYGLCQTEIAEGDNGSIKMYYIALMRAVDTVLEVSFTATTDGPYRNFVSGIIRGYYGRRRFLYEYKCSPDEEKYYKVILFKADVPAQLDSARIPLIRSVMAVPSVGSLIIQAHLCDYYGNTILDGLCEFPAKLRNCSTGQIEGPGCTISLKVNWKCKAAGT